MARSGGDGFPGAGSPGDEPQPAELWITGGSGGPGGSGRPGGTGHGGSGAGGGPSQGGYGGPGRTRWIALAAGFVVLVAVIAVQHFAGGRPSASPSSTGSSSAPVPPSPTSAGTSAGTKAPTASSEAEPGRQTRSGPPSRNSPTSTLDTPPDNPGGEVPVTTGTPADADSPSTAGSPADTTSPSTSSVRKGLLPGAGNWELVGYGPAGVIRYRPSTGRIIVTPVPPVSSNGPLSFVVTRSSAIIRPMDFVTGYAVRNGHPATELSGLLGRARRLLPGPDPTHLWVSATDAGGSSLVLVDDHGARAGPTIDLPDLPGVYGPESANPDGVGYALVTSIGGTYDLRPDGTRLITHGLVLAAGSTSLLVYECDDNARCHTVVIDRKTGGRSKPLPYRPQAQGYPIQGVISPDGRYAALIELYGPPIKLILVDMQTGKTRTPDITVDASTFMGDASSMLAFSPDSRYLLTALGGGQVVPVVASSGHVLPPLPIPPVTAIAVRPTR